MKTNVELSEYTCDGCGKIVHVNEEADGLPPGYHGTVQYVDTSASFPADWYACKPAHVKNAVLNAASR